MSPTPTLLVTEVASYLGSQGVGTVGTNLWAMTMPGTPFVATAVIATGGPDVEGNPTRQQTFQILHRNTHVGSGLVAATTIHSVLNQQWEVLLTARGRIVAVTEPGAYLLDNNGHSVFPMNFVFRSTGSP